MAETVDCLVIGGGLSGLTAASKIREGGRTVRVLDKGRAPGGRMASRRFDRSAATPAVFDYGAQYFTARDPRFRAEVQKWEALGIVKIWANGFHMTDGRHKDTGEPRYRGVPHMRAIADHLSSGLDCRSSVRIVRLEARGQTWVCTDERGEQYRGRALLLTMPVPQALILLDDSHLALDPPLHAALGKLQFSPVFSVLLRLRGPSNLLSPGGLWFSDHPVSWLADNAQKGISRESAIILHASPEFSQRHFDTPPEEVGKMLIDSVEDWLGSEVLDFQVHRWRYSFPQATYPRPAESTLCPLPLFFAGDAFVAPRVEGAYLSGLAAAELMSGL
ncbi:MAG: FAD-dependent oxidoreductase [Calditrichaeota bacterium]|nr:FAD-dependent oxidoreductase [Calditrichota bacterium]